MSDKRHKECYGTMFPDTLHFTTNHPIRGKVFSYELDNVGGYMRGDRRTSMDIEQWDDCLKCPEFEHCYKSCMAKVALQAAIANE